jgi:Spy/CpxP family protein refolding chaperone
MYPGMMGWWKHAHRHGRGSCEGASPGCGPGEQPHEGGHRGRWGRHHEEVFAGHEHDHDGDFGHFGVRRPLRFLAHKLELEEAQVTELARILNELKTERAQAAVDHRRTVAGFADVIAGETFDGDKAGAVATDRVKSAEHLRTALVKALGRIHALLQPEQRSKLAYLIRTGALTL